MAHNILHSIIKLFLLLPPYKTKEMRNFEPTLMERHIERPRFRTTQPVRDDDDPLIYAKGQKGQQILVSKTPFFLLSGP